MAKIAPYRISIESERMAASGSWPRSVERDACATVAKIAAGIAKSMTIAFSSATCVLSTSLVRPAR